jgi:hypothetical protein
VELVGLPLVQKLQLLSTSWGTMIFWIVVAIAALCEVLVILLYITEKWRDADALFVGSMLTIIVGVVLFILAVVLPAAITNSHRTTIEKVTHQVINLQDGLGTQGHISGGGLLFFSINGQIGTSLYYTWYEHTPEGIQSQTISNKGGNKVLIHLIDRQAKPYVVENDATTCDVTSGVIAPFEVLGSCRTVKSWDLYVPRGTITHNLTLNAK